MLKSEKNPFKIAKCCNRNLEVYAKGMCGVCYWQDVRVKSGNKKVKTKPVFSTAIKRKVKKKEPTGELELFERIWKSLPLSKRVSFISGVAIHEFNVSCFMHVLPKGKFKHYRLNPDNIVLGTLEEHYLIDHGNSNQRAKYESLHHCSFAPFYELKLKLLKEYEKEYQPFYKTF